VDEVDADADPDSNANCGSDYSRFAARAIRLCRGERENGSRTTAMEQRIPIRKPRSFIVAPLSSGNCRLAEYCSLNGVRGYEFCRRVP
jgi:hypothetical protein